MNHPGRNFFTSSLSTTEFQLIGQAVSFGSGLGKHDLDIVLPFYLVREKMLTVLSELLFAGGVYPSYGVLNVFSEDRGIADEIVRCAKENAKELEISLDARITLTKGVSTSFTLSLFSRTEKEKLKVGKAQEGHWIYFIALKDNVLALKEEHFFPLDFIKELATSQGIAEAYLLKEESVKDGLDAVLAGTNTFYVEREHGLNALKPWKSGTGILLLSPYRLKKSDENNVVITEFGSVFSKS